MAVVSQPCDLSCNVPQPGELDDQLGEFWEGNPWKIFLEHNLSSFEKNRVFLNAGGSAFLDISFVSGADSDADSRGSFAADVNHDGNEDLVVRNSGGGAIAVYENRFEPQRWLKLRLRGTASNSLGIGARVTAVTDEQAILRECFPTNSFLSQKPTYVHFGLGAAEAVKTLTVEWPSGSRQTFQDVPTNQHLLIVEDRQGLTRVEPGEPLPD